MTGTARGSEWPKGSLTASASARPFISNPDLVQRIATGAPFSPGDVATFYAGGAEGYVDYPPLDGAEAA